MNPEFDRKLGSTFLAAVPEAAGIYIFMDAAALPLYIGKAKNLRRRLAQYRLATRQRVHRKMRAIVKAASSCSFQICANEAAALLLENELIQRHRPALNIAGAYAFLYPYFAFKAPLEASGSFILATTTRPERLQGEGFELFGAFRNRETIGFAYEAFAMLLPFVVHYDAAERKRLGEYDYSRLAPFRQLPAVWIDSFRRFFRGESSQLLEVLIAELLEKPRARAEAAAVQEQLRILKYFYISEAHKLREVLRQQGQDASSIPQELRDRLFLEHKTAR